MLDSLAARSPEPLAVRLGRRSGERDDRWAAAIGSVSTDDVAADDVAADNAVPREDTSDDDITGPLGFVEPEWRDDTLRKRVDELEATLASTGGAARSPRAARRGCRARLSLWSGDGDRPHRDLLQPGRFDEDAGHGCDAGEIEAVGVVRSIDLLGKTVSDPDIRSTQKAE